MNFKIDLQTIANKIQNCKESILTEEATKTALILPVLKALGYDVFNPLEISPEYVTDIGTKKGEKIDYAVMYNQLPTILIECKHWKQNLNLHETQLLRYFNVSKARFGILTNGIIYRIYSDLLEPNRMDEIPFLEFNLTDISEHQIEQFKKFHKESFDVEAILSTAMELKHVNAIKQLFKGELHSPSSDMVKLFARQVYPKNISNRVLDNFTSLTKKAIAQSINELVTERLKNALTLEIEQDKKASEAVVIEESKVVTTPEELEAYTVVKAILRKIVNPSRITYRDAQSYFAIMLDDNNRKSICRLYLQNKKKYLGILDENKKETKFELNSLDDLFIYSDALTQSTTPLV